MRPLWRANKYFGGDLSGKLIFSGGLGGMGGPSLLLPPLREGFLGVDIDPKRIARRLETRYLDRQTNDLEQAVQWIRQAQQQKTALSVGLVGHVADVLEQLVSKDIIPDIVTDQTSAHDPLNGYIPQGVTVAEAASLRSRDPQSYLQRSYASMAAHVQAMVSCQRRGARVFDYGNNLRAGAQKGGCDDAFAFKGFVPEFIRPLFVKGRVLFDGSLCREILKISTPLIPISSEHFLKMSVCING